MSFRALHFRRVEIRPKKCNNDNGNVKSTQNNCECELIEIMETLIIPLNYVE